MTRAIGPAPVHIAPTATPSRPATRQTKSSEETGFAHQLLTLLQPRAATPTAPTPRRLPATSPGSETEEPRSNEGSNEAPHAGANGASSPTPHAASAPSGQSVPTAQAPSSSTAHTATSPTDNSAAVDGTITALAGWIAMKGELDTHDANLDGGHTASSETKSSQSSTLTQAANNSNRSPIALPAMSRPSHDAHVTEPVRETRAAGDSSTSDPQEPESSSAVAPGANSVASTQAGDAPHLPAGVTVLALSTAAPDAAAAPSTKDHDASSATTDSASDAAVMDALAATTSTSDAAASPSAAPADGAAPAPGPDVASALAANTVTAAPSDRITMQLPTDQGSARIQIAVSNGTVVTRIMMPDATSAAQLSASSGELHDALARQGFDAVKIAVPTPPSSGPSSLSHSAERSPDRTPDRAPQQSFTSAQDHKTPGRPQQRPRRQRER